MAVTQYDSIDSVSVGATELSIISGTTTLQTVTDDGIYSLIVDPVEAALAKGDYFKVRAYEKVLSGGTKRVVWDAVIGNAQAEPFMFPPLMLMHGWDFTIQKLAGTDRSWDASIRGTATTITEAYTQSALSVDGTELSLTGGTSTLLTKAEAGIYQLWIDPVTNMAKGDEFVIRAYEKAVTTKRQVFEIVLMDVQMQLFVSPFFTLINGWEMTMQRTAGTARAFDTCIRKVA